MGSHSVPNIAIDINTIRLKTNSKNITKNRKSVPLINFIMSPSSSELKQISKTLDIQTILNNTRKWPLSLERFKTFVENVDQSGENLHFYQGNITI